MLVHNELREQHGIGILQDAKDSEDRRLVSDCGFSVYGVDLAIEEACVDACYSSSVEHCLVNNSELSCLSTDFIPDVTCNVELREHVFFPPVSEGGRVVEIYQECVDGSCSCNNIIGESHCNLRPCRVGEFLFSGKCSLPAAYVYKIWNGLCDGFKIVDEGCDPTYDCENYLSISTGPFRKEMSALLLAELSEGKVSKCIDKPKCIHSMGAVSKSDGRLRPITDCSMPDNISVNNFMSTTCEDFKYKTVNDVTASLVQGDFMCVVDIASAYRSVPIFPLHSHLQGMRWDFDNGDGEVYLRENRLCFGLKCAPFIFSMLSDLVVDISMYNGVDRIVNYLDDFIISASTSDECVLGQSILLGILRHLGFSVSWKKVSSPSTITTFLGIIINSLDMNLTLPDGKITKLLQCIAELESRGRATKKQLEKLGGLVSHFSSVIRGGRTFCRRIYDLFNECPKRGFVRVSEEFLLDLSWWKRLCNVFNGSARIIGKEYGTTFTTDASTWGFGGWSEGDWFLGCWEGRPPPSLDLHDHVLPPPSNEDCFSRNINVYELYAVLVALRRWGPLVPNTLIQVVTDNNQVMYMLNTGRSSNHCCMSWLREIFWLCFIFNVELYSVYIKSSDNVFADALSRADDSKMCSLVMNSVSSLNLCCHTMLDRSVSQKASREGE